MIGIADPDVLAVAAESSRILISHDRKTIPAHFARFLRTRSSPGVIIVSQDLDIGAAIDDLLLIWAATDAEEWAGQLGFIGRGLARHQALRITEAVKWSTCRHWTVSLGTPK